MKEERIKFTYRYNSDIEDILKREMKRYNISSLNKLIDRLVLDATVNMPKTIKGMEKELSNARVLLQKVQREFEEVEEKYKELKELLIRESEIKEKIKININGKEDTYSRKP